MIRVEGAGKLVKSRRTVHRPDMQAPVSDAPSDALEGAAAVPVRRSRPEEPTAAELATNFAGAMARWAAEGFPVVDQAVYAARTAACDACELWVAEARLGLGKCLAPGCGCTKLKRWLASEVCKHPDGSRWAE